jgi:transcriptional regulator with XRE-family HTH domain
VVYPRHKVFSSNLNSPQVFSSSWISERTTAAIGKREWERGNSTRELSWEKSNDELLISVYRNLWQYRGVLQIASLRTARNLSQAELAQAVGVSVEVVQRWENGARGDRVERSCRLCLILNCEAGLLLARGLKPLRVQAGLTQVELAIRLGTSDRIIRAWERGEKGMEGLAHAVALCAALDCKTGELIKTSA